MKKVLSLLLLLFWGFSSLWGQENPYSPEGIVNVSIRNDNGKSKIYPSNYANGIKMSDINNLYGDNWVFAYLGRVNGLSDITESPKNGWTAKVTAKEGCGYVAYYNGDYNNRFYVRIFIETLIVNKSREVIGAEISYQCPFISDSKRKEMIVEQAKRDSINNAQSKKPLRGQAKLDSIYNAQRIFWNGERLPDKVLRKHLLSQYDKDKDGILSQEEVEEIKHILLGGGILSVGKVKSLEGIANLVNLEELELDGMSIENSIILNNTKLKRFSISKNEYIINKVDLALCGNMSKVIIKNCGIGKLNLSETKKLDTLTVEYSKIDTVLLRNCQKLKEVQLYRNSGSVLNLENCTSLESVSVDGFTTKGGFANINANGCSSLKDLQLDYNMLISLNLKGCSGLKRLSLLDTNLSTLNISDCVQLYELDARGTKISRLDLLTNSQLENLFCHGSENLSLINLAACKKLKRMGVSGVNNLDLTTALELTEIEISGELTELNVSNCKKLEAINISAPKLKQLDISKCADNLRFFWVENCPLLKVIYVNSNQKNNLEENWKDGIPPHTKINIKN